MFENKPNYQRIIDEYNERDKYIYAIESSLNFKHIKVEDEWKIEKKFKTVEERNEYLHKLKNKNSKYFKYRKKNLKLKEKKDGRKNKK
ncbi:MAG: hypothetical protein ACOC33_03130 [bacterium]